MAALTFNESLVMIIEEPLTREQAEGALADVLHEAGYVKDSYRQAILDREASFPTGLFAGDVNVAIPHCDVENVNEGAMCVGVLRHPATWGRMEDKTQTCEVSLVVMLALTDPKDHLETLRKVIGLVQDQELVARVVAAETPGEVFSLVADKLA
ncbi:PTS sugar transporter subunit IIA [Thermophilibacter provencensis]|uniref:PTS sugar transporter subunit IIA n=1 Tax=Thermophilibacter provencensis TaxID=1852386 RepID=UPI00094B5773|nr:PTS sugar transporter subunit IIA [Thermophilibacter provencensis]